MIEADLHILLTESVYHRRKYILPVRSIGHLVIGMFSIPKTETLMVFCRDYKIFHPRVGGVLCPEFRVIKVGVKMVEIFLVSFRCYLLHVLYPFMPCGKRIKPPVNKQTEPVLSEPACISR